MARFDRTSASMASEIPFFVAYTDIASPQDKKRRKYETAKMG